MYSIPMALVDFIPVLLFGAAAFILMRDLYYRMSKGGYAMLCTGFIDVFMSGFLKALYKLLYAAGICNFVPLSQLHFPMQSLGFLMIGLAMVCFAAKKQKGTRLYAAAPVAFSGTAIFVVFMVLGLGCMDISLAVIAGRMKNKGTMVFFILACLLGLAMGYLSSKDFSEDVYNWIAECVNIGCQVFLLIGVKRLDKAGLANGNSTPDGGKC